MMDKFTCCVNTEGLRINTFKSRCLTWVKGLLGLEIFLEDIPQLLLTVMILKAKNGGQWSAVAVFNATTSGFNFVFNILDMLMPLDEKHVATKGGDGQAKKKKSDDDTNSYLDQSNGSDLEASIVEEGSYMNPHLNPNPKPILKSTFSYEEDIEFHGSSQNSTSGSEYERFPSHNAVLHAKSSSSTFVNERLSSQNEVHQRNERLSSQNEVHQRNERLSSQNEVHQRNERLSSQNEVHQRNERLSSQNKVYQRKSSSSASENERLPLQNESFHTKSSSSASSGNERLPFQNESFQAKSSSSASSGNERLPFQNESFQAKSSSSASSGNVRMLTQQELFRVQSSSSASENNGFPSDEARWNVTL